MRYDIYIYIYVIRRLKVKVLSLLQSTIHNTRVLCSTYRYVSFNSTIKMVQRRCMSLSLGRII